MASKFQALAILLLTLSLASFSLLISALAPVPCTLSFTDDSGNHPPPISPPSNGGPMIPPPLNDATCNKKRAVELLDSCTDLLRAVSVSAQIPPNDSRRRSCCSFLSGIAADADAAVCLCVTIKVFLRDILNVDATVRAAIRLCNRNPPNNVIHC
nr:pEARLI1-like lipid transfer protein 3 [Ipomoea batatas]